MIQFNMYNFGLELSTILLKYSWIIPYTPHPPFKTPKKSQQPFIYPNSHDPNKEGNAYPLNYVNEG